MYAWSIINFLQSSPLLKNTFSFFYRIFCKPLGSRISLCKRQKQKTEKGELIYIMKNGRYCFPSAAHGNAYIFDCWSMQLVLP